MALEKRVKLIDHLFRSKFMTSIIESKILGKEVEDVKHCIYINNYCDLKGAAVNRNEWLQLKDIAFSV